LWFHLIFQENRRKPWISPIILAPLSNQAFNPDVAAINRSFCGKSQAKPMPKKSMNADGAATISLKTLAFLAHEPARLDRFLALTGIEPGAISELTLNCEFQSAVLEYLLSDENLLLEFCGSEALDPTLPAAALRVLADDGSDHNRND
jgi:hypothetical protein